MPDSGATASTPSTSTSMHSSSSARQPMTRRIPMADYFTITRTLRAPRELVFEAITKPEHFSVWFGTAAVEVPHDTLTMDVRPGGDFRAVMHLPDGNRINWTGSYIEVDPPSHLAMTISDQPGDDVGLPVLFDLEEVDGGTQLTI